MKPVFAGACSRALTLAAMLAGAWQGSGMASAAPAIPAAPVTPATAASADARQQPSAARHALIVGIGDYVSPGVPQLRGIDHDIDSATRMAIAMQVPPENIRVLRNHEASAANIEAEIAALNARTAPGDRVFFYFSGHGSRWLDATPSTNGCVEALLAADSKPLTNAHMAQILKPIADKADKLMVFYDACYSGGVVGRPMATMRSLAVPQGKLTPKFSADIGADQCSRPVNIRTRGLTPAMVQGGGLPQNIVQISSSRPEEVSFDDESAGGMATQAWRDCMLGESRDLDGSGGVSVSEIAACAQTRIDARFAGSTAYAAQHVTLGGNPAFVPNWFASAFAPAAGAAAVTTAAAAARGPEAALEDVYGQRDARRSVTLTAPPTPLRIGQDKLALTLRSSHAGYLYLIMLGSDNQSYYLLFPNDRDRDNRIHAGETLTLPRPAWQIVAQGPAGTDRMLAVVTASPRDIGQLGALRAGPFVQSLTDAAGRANLGWVLGTSSNHALPECRKGGTARDAASVEKCSNAFGATQARFIEQ